MSSTQQGFQLTENSQQQQSQPQQPTEIRLVDVPINDENTALNLMAQFLALAQKRGIFSFEESAKIWECIKKFQK
jgi:hypothetical protein